MIIQVKGIKQVQAMMDVLPNELNKELGNKAPKEILTRIQKSARIRAPKWTGKLAESINLKRPYGKRKEWKLVVESPYAIFQEFGFRPHGVQLFRSTRSGLTVADWAASKGIDPKKGVLFVSGTPQPFMIPALQSNLGAIPNILLKSTKNAINKSIRR